MKVRVVDYVANLGGGVRFAGELLRALSRLPGLSFEVVSSGLALERYRTLLGPDLPCGFVDLPPSGTWRRRTLLAGIPGAGPLNRLLGCPDMTLGVPRAALEDCDVAWFPWVHGHRLPHRVSARLVGSLHDTIILDFPQAFPLTWRKGEARAVRGWLDSEARVAVSSRATRASLGRIFGIRESRVAVVPLSGRHAPPPAGAPRQDRPFARTEYLFCPANPSVHKNHEVLLAAMPGIAARHPLVLTGEAIDIYDQNARRARQLRALAAAAGLLRDETLFALGYVGEAEYDAILEGAWALVMPTLAEGGGSFPVWEALERGIPAVVSDIPVLREMMERTGGEVLWFDPRDPADLARALRELEEGYAGFKARAVEQVGRLHRRSWRDVAADYAALLGVGPSAATPPGGEAP